MALSPPVLFSVLPLFPGLNPPLKERTRIGRKGRELGRRGKGEGRWEGRRETEVEEGKTCFRKWGYLFPGTIHKSHKPLIANLLYTTRRDNSCLTGRSSCMCSS